MKKIILLLGLILVLQIAVIAQTKISEVERPVGEILNLKLDELFLEMDRNPESRGLVVVCSGLNRERIGNTTAVIEGVKAQENFKTKGRLKDRISVIIVKCEVPLKQEFWLIKKDEEKPEFEEVEFDFSSLTEKLLFASECIGCATDYAEISGEKIDYKLLAEILEKNSSYDLLITINGNTVSDENGNAVSPEKCYENLRDQLSKKLKVKKDRFKFEHKIHMQKLLLPTTVEFYIVPNNKEK